MKSKFRKFLLIILSIIIFKYSNLNNVSMVYNFRLAQITKQFQFDKEENNNSTILFLFFDQFRKKYTNTAQNFIGGFGSFIRDYKSFYLRIDSAFSHTTEKKNKTVDFSGTQTDDILFSFGDNFFRNDKNIVTFTGLVGVPTHRILRLKHVDFGYGQFSIGIQLDGSYSFLQNHKNILLYGARYIYFVPGNAIDNDQKKHTFSIGNMVDLLIAHKNRWGDHSLEYGYSAKFRFGAKVFPKFDEIIEKTNYIRSNFYIAYSYKFLIKNITNKIFANLSYSFDHVPKKFGNKFIVVFWTSWNILNCRKLFKRANNNSSKLIIFCA